MHSTSSKASAVAATAAMLTFLGAGEVAGDPVAPAISAPSATPSAAPRRSLERAPPGEERTPMPKGKEWEASEVVEVGGPLPDGCEARLLREWLRLRCVGDSPQSASLLSGAGEGIAFWLQPMRQGLMPDGKPGTLPGVTELVLALRRGDRRIVQLATASEGYDGVGGHWIRFTLSEQWLDDQSGPWVVVTEPR
jgi:hypothetical protein